MSLKARRGAGNVADNVWLSLLGLVALDRHLSAISAGAEIPIDLEHRAIVADDGCLHVRCRAGGREFTLRVTPDQWGWCNSPESAPLPPRRSPIG